MNPWSHGNEDEPNRKCKFLEQIGAHDAYCDSKLGPCGALGTVQDADDTLVDLPERFRFGGYLSATARLENILDVKYSEINGFRTRGRGLYVSFGV